MPYWIKRTLFLIPLAVLLLSGCAKQEPYNYAALEQSKPRSILVLPPVNNTVEVNAPYIYLSTISRPLAEKGYYVFPVTVVDSLMKENGLPSPAEMHAVPLDKLTKHIGADSVLYVTIDEWGQKYQVLSSKAVVRATLKLVDSRTGALLWDTEAFAQYQSSDGGGGLAGALIGAVVEQIAGSMIDRTPDLSRIANNGSINNQVRGLLNGPYAPESLVQQH